MLVVEVSAWPLITVDSWEYLALCHREKDISVCMMCVPTDGRSMLCSESPRVPLHLTFS